MRQSGRVVISNHTEYDWKRTYCVSYELRYWNFPEIIPKNTSIDCWVEWGWSPFRTPKNSRAGCVYQFVGTNRGSFFLGASSEDGLNLFVEYEQLFNLGTKRIDLGWYRNGIMPFFIAGTSNNYISTETLTPPSSAESSRRSSREELHDNLQSHTGQALEKSPPVKNLINQLSSNLINSLVKDLAKSSDIVLSDKMVIEKRDELKNNFEFETFSAVFAVLILVFTFTVFVLINQQHRLI